MSAGSSRELAGPLSSATRPTPTAAAPPRLEAGVRLLGEFGGPGFTEPHYLVERGDGQLLQVSRLLFLVALALDGRRTPEQVADRVSTQYGRTLTTGGLDLLLEQRLRPMGIAAPAHPASAERGDDAPYPVGAGTAYPAGVRQPPHRSPHQSPTRSPAQPPPQPPPTSRSVLTLRLRRVLLPAPVVQALAHLLAPLFHPAVVVVALASLVVADVRLLQSVDAGAAFAATLQTPTLLLALLGVLVASTLFHELGHAAACRYGGAQPGAIGMAVYVVYPAFYTDVTASYRLGRAGRVRTDLGGVYFNALFALGLIGVHAWTGWDVVVLAVALVHLELLQQLLPLARLDGYFVVADGVGVPDLFSRIRPILASLVPGREPGPRVRELRPAARAVVTLWVLTAVPVMVVLLGLLVWNAPAMLAAIWAAEQQHVAHLLSAVRSGDVAQTVLSTLSVLLLPLPLVGLALLLLTIGRRLLAALVGRFARPSLVPGPPTAGRPPSEVTMSGSKPAPVLPMMEGAPTQPAAPPPTPPPPTHGVAAPPHQSERPPGPRAAAPPTSVPASPPPAASAPQEPEWGVPGPHTASEFTEEAMLRRRTRPASRGWRRGVYAVTGGTVNLGPGAEERRQIDLLAQVRTPIRGCRRVVVLSRKGGAGKTTTTLMLGHTFATHRGDRVVALDANPDAGSLAHRMRRESPATVTDLLQERQYIERYADMRGYTSQAVDSRLEVVASDDDPRITQALGEDDYRTAIDVLDRHYNLLLVDTGTGILDSAIRGVLSEADQIVVVMPPALDGARVAAMTLDWLEEHGHADLVEGAVAVVNAVHGEGPLELDRIDQHFAARCSAVVHIPWDVTLQAGAHTSLGDLRRETRDAYLELAATVGRSFTVTRPRRGQSVEGSR
ncbi:MinD/ParA family protein [Phycicoccus sp. SLBN-51]|uniref:MinD/ParA family ATP-binding protein n=1 Tax=Phycicoccus sp. SLBN-51 TaxID=2768447 RepID=UPI0011519919|nr:MinD/ParA family protein [Phycicoccus sp. SLBN-51]